jgi:guanylate kinase
MTRPVPRLLILYGPPASGKSTITAALENLNPRFRIFPRLKMGEGRQTEYRPATHEELQRLHAEGEIIWENERYGAVYAIDRGHITAMLDDGLIPVVHVGQAEAVGAVAKTFPDVALTCVSLSCPRSTAASRITERATGDTAERLAVYDDTPPLTGADLVIDTSATEVEGAAWRIARACLGERGNADGV